MQKIFIPCKADTYVQKSLVVGVPFSNETRKFVGNTERLCVSVFLRDTGHEPRVPNRALLKLNTAADQRPEFLILRDSLRLNSCVLEFLISCVPDFLLFLPVKSVFFAVTSVANID